MSNYFGTHEGYDEDSSREIWVEGHSPKTVFVFAQNEKAGEEELEKYAGH